MLGREDAEQFIEEVRGDDPEAAAKAAAPSLVMVKRGWPSGESRGATAVTY